MMIQMKKVKQACKTQRVSIALDQNALNEINYMTSKSNVNRSALIRSLVEEWCARNRQLDSSNSEMIHQINEPTQDCRFSLVK
jgi:metal-responsive CopG/Arc/MetJ family transcriptional regulator